MDLDYLNSSKCPVDALLDELVKRNITLSYLCEVLQKAELTDIVAYIGREGECNLNLFSMLFLFKSYVGD